MGMEYFSCRNIEGAHMNFLGRVDMGGKVTLCCENIDCMPWVAFSEFPEETLVQYMEKRKSLYEEGIQEVCDGKFNSQCKKCPNWIKKEWNHRKEITYVNISVYPAPCQSKCIYCTVPKNLRMDSVEVKEGYDKLFEILEYAKKEGRIAKNALWQVSTGEITIHPYRDRIFDLVKGERTTFFTNCIKFDERIALNLQSNSQSAIDLSIDSCTKETWRKVKGVNCFDDVISNLFRYRQYASSGSQIKLKYIVLPDINDDYKDFSLTIELMKKLEITHLFISRDVNRKYVGDSAEKDKLIRRTAVLVRMCQKSGMEYSLSTYTPEEIIAVLENAEKVELI